MKLRDIAEVDSDSEVTGFAIDHRKVARGSVFGAFKGAVFNGEDFIDELRFDADGGPVVLKLVKPCVRCTIPGVDPATGEQGHEPGDTLAGYRADSRMDGGITFGMNAVIVEGVGAMLRPGLAGVASLAF